MRKPFVFLLIAFCFAGCSSSPEWPTQFTADDLVGFVEKGEIANVHYINDDDLSTYGEIDAKADSVITFDFVIPEEKMGSKKEFEIKIECNIPTRIQVISNLNSSKNCLLFDDTVTTLNKTLSADEKDYHICIYPAKDAKIKIYEL